jgi:alpha-tubulin suppressor-like RCC1 family protein
LSSAVVAAAAFVSAPLGRSVVAAAEPPLILDVWSWGQSRGGLAGGVSPNPTIPWPLAERGEWVDVRSSGFHTLVLDAAGQVWAWGLNDQGQLGDGTHARRLLPVRVQGLSGVDQIAAGRSHSLAYRESDSIRPIFIAPSLLSAA